jgi:hypothetical protein
MNDVLLVDEWRGRCGKKIAYRIGSSRRWECVLPAGHTGQHRKEKAG